MFKLVSYHSFYIHRSNKLYFKYNPEVLNKCSFQNHLYKMSYKKSLISSYHMDKFHNLINTFSNPHSTLQSENALHLSLDQISKLEYIFSSFIIPRIDLQLYSPSENCFFSSPKFNFDYANSEIDLENYYKIFIENKHQNNEKYVYTRFNDLVYKKQKPLTLYSTEFEYHPTTMLKLMTQLETRKLICLQNNSPIEKNLKKVRIEVYDKNNPIQFFQLTFDDIVLVEDGSRKIDFCFPILIDDIEKEYILVKPQS